MTLYTVINNNIIQAADFVQILDIFQREAGQTESAHYFLSGNSPFGSALILKYIRSYSKQSVPLSVTFDTSDTAPSNVQTPTTSGVSSMGFTISTFTTGSTHTDCSVGGRWTLQY